MAEIRETLFDIITSGLTSEREIEIAVKTALNVLLATEMIARQHSDDAAIKIRTMRHGIIAGT